MNNLEFVNDKIKHEFINDLKTKIWDLKNNGSLNVVATDELFTLLEDYKNNFGKYKNEMNT